MTTIDRRRFLAAAGAAGAAAAAPARAIGEERLVDALDKARTAPVVRTEGLRSPVIIESLRLLKKDGDHFVHVRSKDGAEGVSLTNPGRPSDLAPLLKQRVFPVFLGADARELERLLWDLYRHGDNYKLQGLALWSPQAWVEFAILDMLGRMAGRSIGDLIGGMRRPDVALYVASGRRDTTPEQEIDHLKELVGKSGARALKFRVGGRMSRNEDASPDRTARLIPLVRKTFGDAMDIHADSNSSYDAAHAIPVGRMLEEVGALYFEEPCEFDDFEGTKAVADALTIPVAGGEQEASEWRFRWTIANRGVDIVQPDLQYYGGLVRSVRVARMAAAAGMATTAHISGGFGFVYMLHFAGSIADPGKYQEYKLGLERYSSWFNPPLRVKDGRMNVPTGPGVGITSIADVLKGAVEV
jgi:L-alanine-DL-glutamate epimerase-like enolase superfamily enzyme